MGVSGFGHSAGPGSVASAYAIRSLACSLTMECALRNTYMVAMGTKVLGETSAAELSMIRFWNLIILWLEVWADF